MTWPRTVHAIGQSAGSIDRRTVFVGAAIGLLGSTMPQWADAATPAIRSLKIVKRYLNIPAQLGTPSARVSLRLGNKVVREISVGLALGKPDFWVFMDLAPFKGRTLTLTLEAPASALEGFDAICQADYIIGYEQIYHEALRPQLHFSPKRGWMSDPNGLVFHDGEYHLFYQHYPYEAQPTAASDWQMHWGHAVSKDLVHWQELPEALYPEERLSIWSGSAVVDENNSGGFQNGPEKSLVALFTLADVQTMITGKGQPFVQGLAYSNDRGRTWTKYTGNPVLPTASAFNRDPKVIWYAPENKWVMTLFLDRADYAGHPKLAPDEALQLYRDKSSYGFFDSTDLKNWRPLSEVHIPGETECPELFEIPFEDDPGKTRWIVQGRSGLYLIGKFDGIKFISESGPHLLHKGNGWIAAQTFNDIPDGRRILIAWAATRDARGEKRLPVYKGMPFNQCMGIPVELTLRTTAAGLRLCATPVRELATLRRHSFRLKAQPLKPGTNPLAKIRGELLEIVALIAPNAASQIVFGLRGIDLVYDVGAQQLTCADTKASLPFIEGRLRLRILVDRTLIEIFGNDGELYQSASVVIPATNQSLTLSSDGEAFIEALEVYSLKSIWCA
jgi:sucrose-6-phosphate hydrolase SacC (GH32 family)